MPPRSRKPSRKPSRFDSIPPGASFEDDVQLDELRQPWSLTFGEFLRLVRERYGFTEHRDEEGFLYLRSPEGRRVALPALAIDGQLDEEGTGYLCSALGVPSTDFGLSDEKPEERGPLD